jgi:hypothetical protein
MSIVSGVVYKVFEKQFGNKSLYSIKLDGDASYYGTGESKPAVQPGNKVSFSYTVNEKGYPNAVVDTIKVDESAPAPRASTPAPAKGGENWEARKEYWDSKDKRDLDMETEYRYRSASSQAIQLLQVAADAEALPFTKAELGETPAAKAKKFDALVEMQKTLADQLAEEFHSRKGADEDLSLNVAPEQFGDVEQ